MAIQIEYPTEGEAPKAHVDALRRHDEKIRSVLLASGQQKFRWKRDLSVQRRPYYRLIRSSDGRELFEQALAYFKSQDPEIVAQEVSASVRTIEEKEE